VQLRNLQGGISIPVTLLLGVVLGTGSFMFIGTVLWLFICISGHVVNVILNTDISQLLLVKPGFHYPI